MCRHYFALLVLFSLSLDALASSFMLRNFDVDQGLPSSETHQVFQDSKGYIWIATDAGVSRYDGYKFTNFTTREGLSDNTVFGFYEDRKGRIWFRTFSGAPSYYYQGLIHSPPGGDEMPNLVKGDIPVALHVDEQDTLWLATHNSLFKMHLPTGKCQKAYTGACYYIKVFPGGQSIFGRDSSVNRPRLGIITPEGMKAIATDEEMLNGAFSYLRMYAVPDGSTGYFLSEGSSVYRLRDHRAKRLLLPINDKTNLFIHTENNFLWIGKAGSGVMRVDLNTMDTLHLLNDLSVSNMLIDKAGGYWFSTTDRGIFYLNNFKVSTLAIAGQAISNIQALETAADALFIGTPNGLYKLAISSNTFEKLLPEYTRSLCYTNNRIYAGTSFNTYTLDPSSGKKLETFEVRNVTDFDVHGRKLFFQNQRKAGILSDRIPPMLDIPVRIHSIYAITDDSLLLGTRAGIYAMRSSGNPQRIFADVPVLDCRIEDIKEGSDGIIYFATRGHGLILCRNKRFYRIDKESGLQSDICRKILVASTGYVYVGTNNGISVFKPGELQPFSFISRSHGLVSDDVQCLIEANGRIYAGTPKGVSAFPLSFVPVLEQQPFLIEFVQTPDSTFHFAGNVTLGPSKDFFSIHFVALRYDNRGEVIYRYRIPEIDSAWKRTANTFVNVVGLPKGNYTFEVQPLNMLGQSLAKASQVSLTLEPYFFQTRWFIGVCLLFGIGVIVLTINFLYRRKLEKSRTLTKFAELELKALRSQINPHFIFNCLTSVQHFILNKDVEGAGQYLAKFSAFLRNSLYAGRENFISFTDELKYLELYVELESMRMEETFSYTFDIEPELLSGKIYIPPMLVQPYIENAIFHGLFRKKGDKKLALTFAIVNDQLKIIIADNGIGRSAAASYSKEINRPRSLGMTITRERLEMLHLQTGRAFSVIITDEYIQDNIASGTKVELSLPIIDHTFIGRIYRKKKRSRSNALTRLL